MLSEGSSVKGSPKDKQSSGRCIKGSAKISRQVTLALYTGISLDQCDLTIVHLKKAHWGLRKFFLKKGANRVQLKLWDVLVLLNSGSVRVRLDCFSHSITMDSVQNSQKLPNRAQGCGRFPEFLTFFTWTYTNLEFRCHRKWSLNRQSQCKC